MKIHSIKISNIFSFEYKENTDEVEKLSFEDSLNILIGANGSGKSNFIEVLNQIFKRGIFRECNYNESNLINKNSKVDETLLDANEQGALPYLTKNRDSNSGKKEIRIGIGLNDNDFENMKFVVSNASEIKSLLGKYAKNTPLFSENINLDKLTDYKEIDILISGDESLPNNNRYSLQILNGGNGEMQFIKWYLEYFKFLQRIIEIRNNYENKDDKWLPLKNTFAMISCYRNYNSVSGNYQIVPNQQESFKESENKLKSETTRGANATDEPAVIDLVKRKFAYKYNELIHSVSQSKADVEIEKYLLYKNINELLDKHLRLKIKLKKPNPHEQNIIFHFLDKRGRVINVQELSAGEKGILHFIFSIFGHDLKNGMMVIDEPELHLHPKMQQEYLQIMKETSKNLDIQFVIATHNPAFVDKDTISNVYRFKIENGFSKIIHPEISATEKELVRILTYTNSAKIFFSQRVVLVEGETDEYFFRRFCGHYDSSNNSEFINIFGKGKRTLWIDFLKKFGVETFFIGDWDNVLDFEILNKEEIKTLQDNFTSDIYKKIAEEIDKKNSLDKEKLVKSLDSYLNSPTPENLKNLIELRNYIIQRLTPYKELVSYFITKDSANYNKVIEKIEEKYKEGIFILKKGELEDYLGIKKGMGEMINFCSSNFDNWLKDSGVITERQEVEQIFNYIKNGKN